MKNELKVRKDPNQLARQTLPHTNRKKALKKGYTKHKRQDI